MTEIESRVADMKSSTPGRRFSLSSNLSRIPSVEIVLSDGTYSAAFRVSIDELVRKEIVPYVAERLDQMLDRFIAATRPKLTVIVFQYEGEMDLYARDLLHDSSVRYNRALQIFTMADGEKRRLVLNSPWSVQQLRGQLIKAVEYVGGQPDPRVRAMLESMVRP